MGSPEYVRSSMRTDIDEDIEVSIDAVRYGDDWVTDDNKRQCSTTPDRIENWKRVGGSTRADSDQGDFGTRNESRSKLGKKKLEVITLDALSTWYQDGESDNKLDGGDKPGSGGYTRVEEGKRKNSILLYAEHDTNVELVAVRDTRDLSRRERGYGYAEHRRNHKRRWDEPEEVGRATECGEKIEARIGDPTLESSFEKERSDTLENNLTDAKGREFESRNDKGMKSREDRRVDSDRVKRGRSEFPEDDTKGSLTHKEMLSKERFDEHGKLRNPNRDVPNAYGRCSNADEYASTYVRDKARKDVENSNMSGTPEKVGRRPTEADNLEVELETNSNSRRKELGNDSSWDERSKATDDSWGDSNRDREYMKDNWKRKQDLATKDGEITYDNIREWDVPRRGRDRIDGRSGGRKDGSRTEAVKTSSKYGISNENYDVIEIQTKPFVYVREDSKSILGRNGEAMPLRSEEKKEPDAQELSYSREQSRSAQGSIQFGEDGKNNFMDGDLGLQDRPSWRDDNDLQSEKFRGQKPNMVARGPAGGSLPPHGHPESGSYGGTASQSARVNRMGRGGRVRPTGREGQQSSMPLSLVGSPFGPLGLPPPGPMQTLPPNMSPAPGPMSPNVFIPPFQPQVMWSGARGIEMNMLGVPPGLPPVPPGPLGPRFSLTLGNGASGALAFNQSGRGMSPSMSGPNFNAMGPLVRGDSQEKVSGGWAPPRINAPPGKAPSRGEQNDYSQNFVDTGMRPQNFIRELELTSVVEDYPKLRELIQKKDQIVADSASHPMFHKCDLRERVLSPEFFGTKFDVILVDPPWEEYVHRAPGVTDHMEHWTFEEIMNLKIEAITDTPSFIFLWVGDGVGLEQGRQCLKKWGFRRCEDICWVKTNKANATPGLRHDSHTLFQRSKEHCLMGIKGTVRRSTDGHIIHANIDTDVIIAEEPPYGSTAKPEDMYKIIEHFALGRRRLELFGEDHNIRAGWLTVGKELTSSNFSSEGYVKNFSDKDGKVWIGGGGRNPPPEAPHLILTTPDIESLRPKSPMKNQQPQSSSISLTTGNSNNKRPTGNSPQSHPNASYLIQEGSSSNIPSPAPWISPVDAFRGREGVHMPSSDDRIFDMYGGYNAPFVQPTEEFLDYEAHRGMNLL